MTISETFYMDFFIYKIIHTFHWYLKGWNIFAFAPVVLNQSKMSSSNTV